MLWGWREADCRALEALENTESLVGVLLVKAGAIVTNEQNGCALPPGLVNLNDCESAAPHVLDRIRQQVPEHLLDQTGIDVERQTPPSLTSPPVVSVQGWRPHLPLGHFLGPDIGTACVCQGVRAYHLGMSRIHPESPDSDPYDRSVAADTLLRQEPDEEEDEEEDEGNGKRDDDEDDNGDGYSE